jgi:phage-related protein
MRPAYFHPKARDAIKSFPKSARDMIGFAIFDLQNGKHLGMPLSRPMPAVAPGVSELRIRDASGIYRTFYLLKSERGVFVFHAFVKKTQKTPDQEIRLAQRRLREMLYEEG